MPGGIGVLWRGSGSVGDRGSKRIVGGWLGDCGIGTPGLAERVQRGGQAMRPLLKWAGGKSRLAPLISEVFGERCRGRFVEPFLGSASVFLYRRAAGEIGEAVLADVNPKLVAMHMAVRDRVEEVVGELEGLPTRAWEGRYYEVREAFNAGPHEGPLHAARLIWLNRAGFNGLYRENRSGAFNVPMGRYAELGVPGAEHLREVSGLLQGAELVAASFEEVMRRAGSGDQVYCDQIGRAHV